MSTRCTPAKCGPFLERLIYATAAQDTWNAFLASHTSGPVRSISIQKLVCQDAASPCNDRLPDGSLARPDGTHYAAGAAPLIARAVIDRAFAAAVSTTNWSPERRTGYVPCRDADSKPPKPQACQFACCAIGAVSRAGRRVSRAALPRPLPNTDRALARRWLASSYRRRQPPVRTRTPSSTSSEVGDQDVLVVASGGAVAGARILPAVGGLGPARRPHRCVVPLLGASTLRSAHLRRERGRP